MTSPIRQTEVEIYKGKIVKPGDQVNLLPASLRLTDPERDDFFTEEEFRQDEITLGGTGPFTINLIGRWPCGQIMIYVTGCKAQETGMYASNFM